MSKNFTKLLLVSGSVLFLYSQSVEAITIPDDNNDPLTTAHKKTQDQRRPILRILNTQLKEEIYGSRERRRDHRKLYVVAEIYDFSAETVKALSFDELQRKYAFAREFIPQNMRLRGQKILPLTYQQAEQLILMSRAANESTER